MDPSDRIEAADAYDAAQDALRDMFEAGNFADLAGQVGADVPAGALLNKAVIEAAVAAVIRRLGELSVNPDRPIAAPPSSAPPPATTPPAVISRNPTGPAQKTLGEVLASLLAEKSAKGVWRDGRNQQGYRNAERFVEHMGADRAVDAIERSDVLAWLASCTNSKGEPLAPTTHNNLVAAVNMLFGHAVLNRWATWNPAQGMRAVDPRADHERRDAFTIEELQKLFGPEFVEWSDYTHGGKRWTARRYVPLLMIGAGMRLREAAQLAVEDVFDSEDGIWVARVTQDVEEQGRARGRRSAKNRSSRRLVPLHDEILRRGFLDFVKARKAEAKRPTEPLFPEMAGKHAVSSLSMSANNTLLPKVGIKRETTSIYSLRRSFITLTEQADAPEKAVKQFVGHTLGSDSHAGYIKPRELTKLVAEVWPALDGWLPEVFAALR